MLLKILTFPLVASTRWLKCGEHATRYLMYQKLAAALPADIKRRNCSVLSISHSEKLIKYLGLVTPSVTEANYPQYSAVDLSVFSSGQFDLVLSDQVLEHVEGDPQAVFNESYRLLKPGGIAVHTTCFINPLHGYPSDFWRFTPDALRLLATSFSEVISCDGFGNRGVLILEALGLRYVKVPHAKWHPLNKIATTNNPYWPISTWIMARK